MVISDFPLHLSRCMCLMAPSVGLLLQNYPELDKSAMYFPTATNGELLHFLRQNKWLPDTHLNTCDSAVPTTFRRWLQILAHRYKGFQLERQCFLHGRCGFVPHYTSPLGLSGPLWILYNTLSHYLLEEHCWTFCSSLHYSCLLNGLISEMLWDTQCWFSPA